MICDLPVPQQSSKHGKRADGQGLIDEWLLPIQRLHGRTTWKRAFPDGDVGNLRKLCCAEIYVV